MGERGDRLLAIARSLRDVYPPATQAALAPAGGCRPTDRAFGGTLADLRVEINEALAA